METQIPHGSISTVTHPYTSITSVHSSVLLFPSYSLQDFIISSSESQVRAPVPQFVCNWNKLRQFIGTALFSASTIPDCFWDIRTLAEFIVSDSSELRFALGDKFANSPLMVLVLKVVGVYGPIPPSLCQAPYLSVVSLGQLPTLSGTVPPCINTPQYLSVLILNYLPLLR